MSAKKTQLFLVIGALVLFVLLFFAPKIAPSKDREKAGVIESLATANIELFVNMASKTLEPSAQKELEELLKNKMFDSAVTFWSQRKRPDIAAFYSEKQAMFKNTAEQWLEAGKRYYYSVQFTNDESEMPALNQSAIRCFQKSVELEPSNTNAKILLAMCFVKTSDPMKGISMLREIERTDSSNVDLQMAFAAFSLESGQLDKAVTRYQKVLRADSTYVEAYLYLAEVYEKQGETKKTINALTNYMNRIADPAIRNEVNNYIEELRNR